MPETFMIRHRFRGFLPIVIDVETAGFDPKKNALLEIAAIQILMHDNGLLYPENFITHTSHLFQAVSSVKRH
jgi:ribonuclease T